MGFQAFDVKRKILHFKYHIEMTCNATIQAKDVLKVMIRVSMYGIKALPPFMPI